MTEARPVLVTYLEQTERPALRAAMPAGSKLAILRAEDPPVHFYRYLYRHVGDEWSWWDRRHWSDEVLALRLADPLVEIYVLHAGGVPAGFAELDRSTEVDGCEVRLFGLMPEFIGRKLGPFFLAHVLDIAWRPSTKRVFLSTCSLDHPGALAMYQRAGFRPYGQARHPAPDPPPDR